VEHGDGDGEGGEVVVEMAMIEGHVLEEQVI